jgi:hypothetical protein
MDFGCKSKSSGIYQYAGHGRIDSGRSIISFRWVSGGETAALPGNVIGNSSVFYYWPGNGVSFFKYPDTALPTDIPNIHVILPTVVLITMMVTAIVWFILAKTSSGSTFMLLAGIKKAPYGLVFRLRKH